MAAVQLKEEQAKKSGSKIHKFEKFKYDKDFVDLDDNDSGVD